MHVVKQETQAAAAVVPTEGARTALRPLGQADIRLREGLLHERQQQNRKTTIRHGLQEMTRVGTIENFRIAAGLATGERRGMVFSDSDVYKWLEAVAWEIGREPSEDLARLANDVIALVSAAQRPDGYLNTYCQVTDPKWRWSDLEMGHELYCAGHLIQAGVAFARATGDTDLLDIARRFADLIDDEFRLGEQGGTDGHPEIEMALVELYRQTAEPRYLQLASTLTDRRGRSAFEGGEFGADYFQETTPARQARTIVGHAVRALYLLSGITDLYLETGDASWLESAIAQWEDLASTKLYLTGGVGSRHFGEAIGDAHELPPDRAYCETCAAVASIMWNWRMLLATGEARYAELMERTLYNGFLVGADAEGKRFFYVNPLQSRGGHRPREPWNPVACCPPNIMRLLASLQQYIATCSDDGIEIHQYASADVYAEHRDARIGLRMRTDFPWTGRIEIEILASTAEEWTLALRVPSWTGRATINGQDVTPGRYALIARRWQTGDRVIVEFDLCPRLTAPHPRIDAIRGCVAIERGPLVYCLEQADLPDEIDLADVRIRGDRELSDALGAPGLSDEPAIRFTAELEPATAWGRAEYRSRDHRPPVTSGGECVSLRAVPYFKWGTRGDGAMRVWIPEQATERK